MNSIDHLLLGTNPETKQREVFIPSKHVRGFYDVLHEQGKRNSFTLRELQEYHGRRALQFTKYVVQEAPPRDNPYQQTFNFSNNPQYDVGE